MQYSAEQVKPTFVAEEFANIGAAGSETLQQQPPPPTYTPAVAPPYYDGGQYVGATQDGTPVRYVVTPTVAGYPQPVAYPNVQVSMLSVAASTPQVTIAQTEPLVVTPQTYLGWSIFNCLCCFWPLGLVAIVYSVKVGNARNHNEAMRHSLTARNLNIAATTITPIIAIVLGIGMGIVLGSASAGTAYRQSYNAPAYYSYGYLYYYSYLMYYTYYTSYSYLAYSYSGIFTGFYSYTAYGYTSVTTSTYAVGSYYQYRADISYG